MRNPALSVLPAASVAAQTTVTVPIEKVVPEAGAQVGVTAPSTRSKAVAGSYTTAAPPPLVASAVTSAGTVTCGPVVSSTAIAKLASPVLPAASVEVQVTVVVPIGKRSPDSASQPGVRSPSTRSEAVAAPNGTSAPSAFAASAVTSSGTAT